MNSVKSILSALAVALAPAFCASAQTQQPLKVNGIFNHLDAGITVGTTGLGLDLESPIGNMVRLRAGVEFMPRFTVPMHFSIEAFDENGQVTSTNYEKMREMLKDMTGYDVDYRMDMNSKATMVNFKLLVDVFPFRNKDWYVTAGFFLGSSEFARSENTQQEMSTLLSMNMYNRYYDFFVNERYLDEPLTGDYFLDPDRGDEMRDKFKSQGRLGVHVGDYKDGRGAYMMEAGSDGMVRCTVKVNRFKPYLGFGYNNVLKANPRFKIGFDAGLMFWGGTPRIVTHDGVNLSKDIDNIPGKVGDYVSTLAAFKVYPSINFRISYSIF